MTIWSIITLSAGLHIITNTLRVGKQNRTEQGSLPAYLSLRQRASTIQLEYNLHAKFIVKKDVGGKFYTRLPLMCTSWEENNSINRNNVFSLQFLSARKQI